MAQDDSGNKPSKSNTVFSASAPTTSVHGSGGGGARLAQSVQKSPDWSEWGHIPCCQLQEACALSMNINPHLLMERHPTGWEPRTYDDKIKSEFSKRLRILRANWEVQFFKSCGHYEHVYLADFSKWAMNVVKWDSLPLELVAMAGNVTPSPTQAAPPEANPQAKPANHQTIANDAMTCEIAEQVHNGKLINWLYWQSRTTTTPEQAARLSLCIDPIQWPDDKWAQGPMPKEKMQEITALRQWLEERSDKWTLESLVDKLGEDIAPFRMKKAVKDTKQTNATQAAPAGTPSPTCAEFRTMAALKPNEIDIDFAAGESGSVILNISARGISRRVALAEIDLFDRRLAQMNEQCALLLGMAKGEQVKNPDNARSKKISRIRKIFEQHFGISDDPFLPYQPATGYCPLFKITDSRGNADERARKEAERRTVPIEENHNYQSEGDETDKWLKEHDDKRKSDELSG